MYKWSWLGAVSRNRVFYRTLCLLFAIPVCHAILVNQTIDSNKGDPVTGFVPIYQPQIYLPQSTSPWADQTCSGCYIQPDITKAYDGTWNAATYHPELQNVNVTLQFTGVAIWVFFILANANSHGSTTTTNTQVNITLDGQYAGTFSHNPDMTTEDLIYNANVFSTSGLSNTAHQVVIATNDYPISTFINFDWAVYTVEQDTPASSNQGTSPSNPSNPSTTTATVSITNSITTSGTSTSSSSSTNGTSSSTPNAHVSAFQSGSSSISASFSSSTTDSSSAVTTSSSTSAPQSLSSKIGIIVGCTLGGLAMIALVLLFLVRRWRRAPPVQSEMTGGVSAIAALPRPPPNVSPQPPIPVFEASQTKAARLRQMEIDERIRSAQREMDHLISVQDARAASEASSTLVSGQPRPPSELGLLRNELQQLREQIGALQAQQEAELALGSSDVPPAYTRH